MTRHEHRIRHTAGHAIWRALAAVTAVTAALAGGLATSTALADEPQKCGTSDTVCYAGWNANGLKQIADDLSVNGKASTYYETMETNLQKDVRGSITLSDGFKLPFRLIGILHDDLADGSGRKAGLTFMAVNAMPKAYCMNGVMPSDTTTTCQGGATDRGGWRDSGLRRWMNGGEVWDMFPESFRTGVSAVLKRSNNMEYGGTSGSAASATSDRLWLVSYRELVPTIYDGWKDYDGFQALNQEGGQYEFFKGRVTNDYSSNTILADMGRTASGSLPAGGSVAVSSDCWWVRSTCPGSNAYFLDVNPGGAPSSYYAGRRFALVPAFSF